MYGSLAEELRDGLLEVRPDLADFPDALASWAENEARAELLRRYLDEVGNLDDEGEPRHGPLKWLVAFERAAETARRALGLDPRSYLELVSLRAEATRSTFDLGELASRGREARQRAEMISGDGGIGPAPSDGRDGPAPGPVPAEGGGGGPEPPAALDQVEP